MSAFDNDNYIAKPEGRQIAIQNEFNTTENSVLEYYELQSFTNGLPASRDVRVSAPEQNAAQDDVYLNDIKTTLDKYIPSGQQVDSFSGDKESISTKEPKTTKKFNTPKVKLKRKADPSLWKKNIRKIKKIRGEKYVGSDGKLRDSRPLLPAPCKGKPNHNCCDIISEEERELIYKKFREMDSYQRQKQYIVHHIEKSGKKRTTRKLESSRRSFTYHYSLTITSSNRVNDKVNVCREFFLATLNVSDAMVRNCVTKSRLGVAERDKRGRHTPHNKISDKTPEIKRENISNSEKKCLEGQMNNTAPEYYEHQSLANGLPAGKGIKIEVIEQMDCAYMHAEANYSAQEEDADECIVPFVDIKTSPDKYRPSGQVQSSTGDEEFLYTQDLLDSSKNNDPDEKTKKKSDPRLWKKNIRKIQKIRGEKYIGSDGKVRDSRPLLPAPCKEKRNHNCCSLINEEERELIYKSFRGMDSYDHQKQYIVHHIEKSDKKRTTRKLDSSRRSFTYHYSLTTTFGNNADKVNVCREFFLATLNVTDAMVRNCVTKSELGVAERDNRGRHTPHNKITDRAAEIINEHISNYAAHYCRGAISEKKCLDGQMNITCMYREYKLKCAQEGCAPVGLSKYRAVFNEYNIGFSKP